MSSRRPLPVAHRTGTTTAASASTGGLWRVAQWGTLAGALVLAFGAIARPATTLPLFWNVVLPVLPLSFLVSPGVWRGICPLATVNMWSSRRGGARLAVAPSAVAGLPGIVLLAAIVPARHALLNTSGLAFDLLLLALVALAWMLGRRHDAKAGYCNSWCPILPVERLYGQRPLLDVANARCRSCSLCTPRGCLDLAGARTVAQTLGPGRRDASWLLTAFGSFAAAFPGFVTGYFTADAAAPATLVYAHVLGCSVLSWGATAVVVLGVGLRAEPVLPVLATIAAGAYYWFAAPNAATALGATGATGVVLRGLLLAAVAAWGVRAVRQGVRAHGFRAG